MKIEYIFPRNQLEILFQNNIFNNTKILKIDKKD